MCTRMISSKERLGGEAQARARRRFQGRRPGLDDPQNRLVRLAADQPHRLLAGHPAQCLDLLGDGGAEAGHRQRSPRAHLATVQGGRPDQELDRRAR